MKAQSCHLSFPTGTIPTALAKTKKTVSSGMKYNLKQGNTGLLFWSCLWFGFKWRPENSFTGSISAIARKIHKIQCRISALIS
jgi:hypothetical protein